MKQTHKAIVRQANGSFQLSEVSTPELTPNGLLVKILKAGVCGTDLQIIRGLRDDPATILGHEGCGEVIAVGEGVKQFAVGDRVTFIPHSSTYPDRILGHNIPGLFQEIRLMNKEDLASGLVVKVNENISDELVVLAEPLGAIIYSNVLVQQTLKPTRVAVFGAGQIGVLYSMFLKAFYPKREVFLIHQDRASLDWFVENKIVARDHLFLFEDLLSGKEKIEFDAGVICTDRRSAVSIFELALRFIRERGIIDLFGGFPANYFIIADQPIFPSQIRQKNVCGAPEIGYFYHGKINDRIVNLTGHRGVNQGHVQEALNELSQFPTLFKTVISPTVSPKEAVDCFNQYRQEGIRLADRQIWLKMIIDFGSMLI